MGDGVQVLSYGYAYCAAAGSRDREAGLRL